jgi:hypothetical protein
MLGDRNTLFLKTKFNIFVQTGMLQIAFTALTSLRVDSALSR